MIEERRKHLRAKGSLPLKIADKAFDIITETVDVSSSGIYCRVTRLLPLMSKIEVVLMVPQKNSSRPKQAKKIRCKGVVVRTEPGILKNTDKAHHNTAIFFTDISEKDRKALESYVESGSANPGTIKEVDIKLS